MEVLFKESYKHGEITYDFEWVQTGFKAFEELAMAPIIAYAKAFDYQNETFIYFYTEIVNDDAIGDKVRTMITVRYNLDGHFDLNFNISDSLQAMFMDRIIEMKQELNTGLNG